MNEDSGTNAKERRIPGDGAPSGRRIPGAAPGVGLLVVATLAGGALCLWMLSAGILPRGVFTPIFEFLLNNYDRPASRVSLMLVLAALLLAPFSAGMQHVAESFARNPWKVAALCAAAMALAARLVYHAHPLSMDEYSVWFQSRVFASGALTGSFPPQWLDYLIPPPFQGYFLIASRSTGAVASAYWPGFALLMAPFSALGVEWLCNPVLAGLLLVATARTCELLFPNESGVAGWAMLFSLASPAFVAHAISFYAMTALLLANLVFLWGFLAPSPRRLFMSGVVGSAALVMHNPVPHLLFAAPWVVWFLLGRPPWRQWAALALGYAPLVLLLGVGWALLKARLSGGTETAGMLALSDSVDYHISAAFSAPNAAILWQRLAGMIKLWIWAVPGLLVLAAMGFALRRDQVQVRLLGASALLSFAGYFFVPYDQGHGWGYRYFHPAWSILAVFAAVAVATHARRIGPHPRWTLPGVSGALVVASLAVLVPLQMRNIDSFIGAMLSQAPSVPEDRPSIVFLYPNAGFYVMDLVQNDPFLRNRSLRMAGRGPEEDANFLRESGLSATRISSTRTGEVWVIEAGR